jgi:hypothetical protein
MGFKKKSVGRLYLSRKLRQCPSIKLCATLRFCHYPLPTTQLHSYTVTKSD